MSNLLLQSLLDASGDALPVPPFAGMDIMEDSVRSKGRRKGLPKGTARQRSEGRLPPLRRSMTDPLRQYEIIPNGNPRFLTKASQKTVLEANLAHAAAFGVFATSGGRPVSVSEQDVRDVGVASGLADHGGEDTLASRLRKRRAIRRNPESHAGMLLRSGAALPEPDLGCSSDQVVTLRIRMLRRKKAEVQRLLPVFAEGDVIVGVTESLGSKRGNAYEENKREPLVSDDDDDPPSASDDDDEQLRRTRQHTYVFRVCAVYWGVKAYVSMLVDGAGQQSMAAGRATAGQNCFAVCRLLKAG